MPLTDIAPLLLAERLAIAALIGLAVGTEREWSGPTTGPQRRFAGLRTFLLFGMLGGIAGLLLANNALLPGSVLLAAGAAFNVVAYASSVRNPEHPRDGTTEAAALVVLSLGTLAGLGYLTLAAGCGAVVVFALGEKQRLHGMVAKVGAPELQAAARFAVMALVILPVLPTEPLPFGGGISPRGLWTLVLLFSAINFCGYLAQRAVGPERGYGLAGLLGGLVSSTIVTLQFARRSRDEPGHDGALALGVIAACTVLPIRLLAILGVLSPPVAQAALPFLLPPALVGLGILAVSFSRTRRGGAKQDDDRSPLHVITSAKMAGLFFVALVVIGYLESRWGSAGVYTSAVVLGLTDTDALTVAMARLGNADTVAQVAARGVAIGVISNTAFKLALGLTMGSADFRRRLALGLGVLGGLVGVGWLL